MFKIWDEVVTGCLQDIKDPNTGVSTGQQAATLSCVPAVFLNVLSALLAFVGLGALIMFMISGVRFMTSYGEAKKLEGARNTFVYGLIGAIIVLTSFLLINLISTITGVECITKFGFGC